MLTETQKHQFDTFGFLLLKNLIPRDEMQVYIDGFDETMNRANGGIPWDHTPNNRYATPFYKHNPAVYHRLLDNDLLHQAVEDLLGKDFVFFVAEAHHRHGGTGWHHDGIAPEEQSHLKVSFFMEPVRADTGALRVIPGTHFQQMRDRLDGWYDANGGWTVADAKASDIMPWSAAIALESDPGDAVIFNVKVYHAAVGDTANRRVIYINYIQKPSTPEEENYITSQYNYEKPIYTPELFEDAPPKRERMLSFVKERCYDQARDA